MTKKVFL